MTISRRAFGFSAAALAIVAAAPASAQSGLSAEDQADPGVRPRPI